MRYGTQVRGWYERQARGAPDGSRLVVFTSRRRSAVGARRRPESHANKPQADRGDLYVLTAATFTVLTEFTRAGPTGLGLFYLIGPHHPGLAI